EFLDALPIRQLVRGHSEWAERLVGVDAEGRLTFTEGSASPALSLLVPNALRGLPPSTIVEICPAAAALAATLGERFAASAGAAARLAALSARAGSEQQALLESGLRRLIDPGEMGTLFKAMAVTSPGLPAPAGFAEAASSGGE